MNTEKGTLPPDQPHPSAAEAYKWLMRYFRDNPRAVFTYQEVFTSSALAGSLSGEVCGETLRRIMHSEPVSDRYLLGLVWFIRDTVECDKRLN